MILSKWFLLNPGENRVDIPIGTDYKIIFNPNLNNIFIDNINLKNDRVLNLKSGNHLIRFSRQAALLVEFNSDLISSESLTNFKSALFTPINRRFSDRFELLGLLTSQTANKIHYRLFWKALSDNHDDLMSFHHFRDEKGNYLAGANIDPTDGWYDIKGFKKGDLITYAFSIDKNEIIKTMDVGWYYKQDWNKRIAYKDSTFFTLNL